MFRAIKNSLVQRGNFADWRSWLLSLYNKVLLRNPNLPLPSRHHMTQVSVRTCCKPLIVRLGTTDWLVLDEIFSRDEYGPACVACAGARAILDLGANVGLSVRFWAAAYPQARIIAVEPDALNYAVCIENARIALRPERVVCVQACISDSDGILYLSRTGGEWAFRSTHIPGENSVRVQSLTITRLLKEHDIGEIDLLKCDIEGAEASLFAHCSSWIRRVRCLVVETHKPYTPEALLRDIQVAGGLFETLSVTKDSTVSLVLLRRKSET